MPNHKPFLPAVILCVICLVTTGLLSLTYELTRSERERQAEAAANANRLALFPGAAAFLPVERPEPAIEGLLDIMLAETADETTLGYLMVCSKRGYGGQVPIMVAVSLQGDILGLRVLGNDETPGLGRKIEGDGFLRQFVGRPIEKPFALSVQSSQQQPIDAISGATISSRAVTEAVNIAGLAFASLKGED